jgi:hypothetical protein
MRASVIAEVTPLFDEDWSFMDVAEPLAVQALVAQLAVEACERRLRTA